MPDAEAETWATELEKFASARAGRLGSKRPNLPKEATDLAAEIRDLARELRDARMTNDQATIGLLLENLGVLRRQALDMLAG
jgi:hypothetical protein